MTGWEPLDHGLRALEYISRHPSGLTIDQLSDALDLPDPSIGPMVAHLVQNGLAVAETNGRIRLGGAVVTMAARFAPRLLASSEEVLDELAEQVRATCFVAVADGDQCVVVSTAEPTDVIIRIGYRIGSRHALTTGAAGIAILALRPETDNDPTDVRDARGRGYALTRGQLESGAIGLATGFRVPQGPELALDCSVGVVALDGLAEEHAIRQVRQAARRLEQN